MSGQEAIYVLLRPVFGDERCIEARDTLRIIDELCEETGELPEHLMEDDIDLESYRYLLEDGSL
jgi:hypothetical protein